jgi:hypothetical protein
MREIEQYYSYLVMPEDRDPSEDLKKAFARSGRKVELEREESETNDGVAYIEWHLSLLPWVALIEVIDYFQLEFKSMDNERYNESETTGLGDLLYSNKDGVTLNVFATANFGGRFKEWGPKLKRYLSKEVYQFKQRTFNLLEYSELDEIIQKHFRRPDYECTVFYEWDNDEEHSGTVSIQDAERHADDIKQFIEGKYDSCHWTTLLSELARRGVVPEGEYIVEVCW